MIDDKITINASKKLILFTIKNKMINKNAQSNIIVIKNGSVKHAIINLIKNITIFDKKSINE